MDKGGILKKLEQYLTPVAHAKPSCKNDSLRYLQSRSRGKEWAIRMWDSASKMQSGLLTGNLHSLGNYDECLRVNETDSAPFGTTYCLATVKKNNTFGDEMGEALQPVMEEDEEINYGVSRVLSQGLRWGFCIPDTCDNEDLQKGLQDHLGNNVSVIVDLGDCTDRSAATLDESVFLMSMILFLFAFYLSIYFMIIANRLHDCRIQSVFENEEANLKYNRCHPFFTINAPWYLPSLDGLKALSIMWVILGNYCLATQSVPAMNYLYIFQYVTELRAMFVLNAGRAADTFLVCCGTLTSYHFLRDMVKRKILKQDRNVIYELSDSMTLGAYCKFLPGYLLHRFMRLTPTMLVVLIAYMLYLHSTNFGPIASSLNWANLMGCHDFKWSTIFYVQNFQDVTKMCLPTVWFPTADMQLYTVSTILMGFIIIYDRSCYERVWPVLLVLWFIFTVAFNDVRQVPARLLTPDDPGWTLKMNFLNNPLSRVAAWLIGINTGHMLFMHKNQPVTLSKKWRRIIRLGVPIAMISVHLLLAPFQQRSYTLGPIWHSLYFILAQTLWSVSIGCIILCCEMCPGGAVKKLLSFEVFQPISRLCYCVYLIHIPLLNYRILTSKTPTYLDYLTVITSYYGDVILSFFVAIPLYVLFERPSIWGYEILAKNLGISARWAEADQPENGNEGQVRGQEQGGFQDEYSDWLTGKHARGSFLEHETRRKAMESLQDKDKGHRESLQTTDEKREELPPVTEERRKGSTRRKKVGESIGGTGKGLKTTERGISINWEHESAKGLQRTSVTHLGQVIQEETRRGWESPQESPGESFSRETVQGIKDQGRQSGINLINSEDKQPETYEEERENVAEMADPTLRKEGPIDTTQLEIDKPLLKSSGSSSDYEHTEGGTTFLTDATVEPLPREYKESSSEHEGVASGTATLEAEEKTENSNSDEEIIQHLLDLNYVYASTDKNQISAEEILKQAHEIVDKKPSNVEDATPTS